MIRIQARNRRGTLRTDFGARTLTAPLERYLQAETERLLSQVLLHGSAYLADGTLVTYPAPEPGFWGLGLAGLLR